MFAGAGASAPLGMKPTGPFMDILPQLLERSITNRIGVNATDVSQGFNVLFEHIRNYYEVETTDSELLLDYLDHMILTCDNLHLLPDLFKVLSETTGVAEYHQKWRDMFTRLRNDIQSVIVEHYSDVDGSEALELYKPLLDVLGSSQKVIPIFTTNYDWAFESLADSALDLVTLTDGFHATQRGLLWNRTNFDNFTSDYNKINLVLFKLHGSTNWYRDDANSDVISKIGMAATEIVSSRASLIYPTQVKADSTVIDPFKTAYEYMRESLSRAHLCVIIGFSFRDPAINESFRQALIENFSLKVLIVEPTVEFGDGQRPQLERIIGELLPPNTKWEEKIRFVKENFGPDGSAAREIRSTVSDLYNWTSHQPVAVI